MLGCQGHVHTPPVPKRGRWPPLDSGRAWDHGRIDATCFQGKAAKTPQPLPGHPLQAPRQPPRPAGVKEPRGEAAPRCSGQVLAPPGHEDWAASLSREGAEVSPECSKAQGAPRCPLHSRRPRPRPRSRGLSEAADLQAAAACSLSAQTHCTPSPHPELPLRPGPQRDLLVNSRLRLEISSDFHGHYQLLSKKPHLFNQQF